MFFFLLFSIAHPSTTAALRLDAESLAAAHQLGHSTVPLSVEVTHGQAQHVDLQPSSLGRCLGLAQQHANGGGEEEDFVVGVGRHDGHSEGGGHHLFLHYSSLLIETC